jgi:hypothetical protein
MAVVLAGGALLTASGSAQAHSTTSTCWEEWDSDFANQNASDNFRLSFLSWSKLDGMGNVVFCPAPQAPGSAGGVDYTWDSIGYNTTCWFYRHRCGDHYIRLDDEVGEGHTWFEEWGDPATASLDLCDPGDGKGTGFVATGSGYATPHCMDWSTANLATVEGHMHGTALILWAESYVDHQFVVYDLDYMQVRSSDPAAAYEVAVKVGPHADDWWISSPMGVNAEIPGSPGQYYYWDTTGWGYEIERAVFRDVGPVSTKAQLGGLYYRTPTASGWGTVDVCGNGSCSSTESCSSCAEDCGACAVCGDHTCNGGESCSTCPGDCGACIVCGDGICNGSETCGTCPGDCGQCTPCNGVCTNPTNITWSSSYQSGNLSTNQRCFQTTKTIAGGNCGNFAAGRTLQINGQTKVCNNQNWASVPAKVNGGYCIKVNAGNFNYAYMTLF